MKVKVAHLSDTHKWLDISSTEPEEMALLLSRMARGTATMSSYTSSPEKKSIRIDVDECQASKR